MWKIEIQPFAMQSYYNTLTHLKITQTQGQILKGFAFVVLNYVCANIAKSNGVVIYFGLIFVPLNFCREIISVSPPQRRRHGVHEISRNAPGQ